MTTQAVERKLAAILAADIVGFSRMMGDDEAGTLAALKECRARRIDPPIAAHRGRIFKTTGDGVLAEFASVIDAVRCAIAIQDAMHVDNVRPDSSKLALRIAVNLGDVMIDGDDVYGDGVNIAARLQALAEPGGVLVPEKVRTECAGKLDALFLDAGQRTLKNIAAPVHVFHVHAGGAQAPRARRQLSRRWLWPIAAGLLAVIAGVGAWQSALLAPGAGPAAKSDAAASRLSVMVLPFTNLGGDPSQDWFADGVTENITSSLSQIPDSFVIARSTAFAFRGKPIDPKQIGREVGVRYLLQGSVQRSGARMRVSAALISTESGGQIWTESFDHEINDLLDLENQVAGRIARALDIKMTLAESRRADRQRPNDLSAIDLAMQGQAILNRSTLSAAEVREARALIVRALERDNRNWSAWAVLAMSYLRGSRFSPTRPADIAQAEIAVARALALAPDNGRVQAARGLLAYEQGRHEEAVAVFEAAIALDRNYPISYAQIGAAKIGVGRPEEAFAFIDQAIRLSPLDPLLGSWLRLSGIAYLHLGQVDKAVAILEKSIAADPEALFGQLFLAAALAEAGRIVEGRAMMRKFLAHAPTMTLNEFKSREPSRNPKFLAQRQRAYDGMLKAGLPE